MKEHTLLWKQFHNNKITHSAAHYLMAIDDIAQNNSSVRLIDVAEYLDTSIGSLYTSLQPLIKKKFILQDEQRHLTLSLEAKKIVVQVKNTAQVCEYFFHDILGVEGSIASQDACKIEHLLSKETTLALIHHIHSLLKQEQCMSSGLSNKEKCNLCKNKSCIFSVLKNL